MKMNTHRGFVKGELNYNDYCDWRIFLILVYDEDLLSHGIKRAI